MKVLKYLLYSLAIILGIFLVLCAVGPKKFETKKSIEINASAESVFEEVSDFNRWSTWSPWHKYDPNMQNTFIGEPATVGHKNEWISKEMGNGSQEIVEIEMNKMVKTALRFEDFKDAVSYAGYNIESNGDKTTATWTMDGADFPFLVRGLMLLMGGQKSIEKDYEEGLKALKTVCESKPAAPRVSYEIIEVPEQWYVGKRFASIHEKDVDSALFGRTYADIAKAIGGMKNVVGMPMSITHSYDMNTKMMDIEIALPVKGNMKVESALNCAAIPAGKVAKHVYYGPYEGTGQAWMAFFPELMKSHKPRWSSYEVYANDPATLQSEGEIETWLIQPIE